MNYLTIMQSSFNFKVISIAILLSIILSGVNCYYPAYAPYYPVYAPAYVPYYPVYAPSYHMPYPLPNRNLPMDVQTLYHTFQLQIDSFKGLIDAL